MEDVKERWNVEVNCLSDEVETLLALMPNDIGAFVHDYDSLIEIVLDLGRQPVIRYQNDFELMDSRTTREDIDFVTSRIRPFADDDRSAIDGQLHRISCIRNRYGAIIGLTCRVGRHIPGSADSIRDLLLSDKSILILGKAGSGKTTKLRAASHILSTEERKRVVIIDTSSEIAGDGDYPHPSIGLARRMQVACSTDQAVQMQRAIENHQPEILIIDEIGNAEEAQACRTIAERGVKLIATAHGNTLEDLLRNPALNDLMGGVESVTIGDALMKQKGLSQKIILERQYPPTFDILIELIDRDTMVVHKDVAEAVDATLRKETVQREMRKTSGGSITIEDPVSTGKVERVRDISKVRLFIHGLNNDYVSQAIRRIPGISISKNLEGATHVITKQRLYQNGARILLSAEEQGIEIITVRSNDIGQILTALRRLT